jgi:hypothetical protein
VPDYPYGYTLRCSIRYWIETKSGHGQRLVSQTTNPKKAGEVWNKPKASTYTELRVLYLNSDNGHVESDALSTWATSDKIAAFEAAYGPALDTDYARKALSLMKLVAARSEAADAARKAVA